jgi:prepilin peptidase CpaA
MPEVIKIALIGLTGIAAITDLYSRRIPNALVVAGFAAGIALNSWLMGWSGLWHSLAGFGLALLLYVLLFLIRAMGGGDVKLMAAAGSILGPREWFTLFIFASLAGGMMAIGMMMARNAFGSSFRNLAHIAKELAHFRAPYKTQPQLDIANARALTMPHGVAIAIGAVLLLIIRG